jgi:hypothetical protein
MNHSHVISQITSLILGFLLLNPTLSACAVPHTQKPIASAPLSQCLPKDIKLSDIVSATLEADPQKSIKVTVEQKLKQFKARCLPRQRKLVDARGKPITFYKLTGCWGNPPSNYQEILKQEREKIARLKLSHTVIEMTCNPSGALIP